MSYSLSIARQCLRLAARSYVEQSFESRRTSTQVLIGGLEEYREALVIAFRGSRELKDYLQDARFIAKTPWCNGGEIDQAVRVHRGFSECYFSVSDELRDRAAAAPRVIVTGHSLGGALATLCALDLAQHGANVKAVHVFGCPRVGNSAFRDLYNAALHDVTIRFEAQGDPVPWLPPYLLPGYRHVGRCAYLKNDSSLVLDPPMWLRPVQYARTKLHQADLSHPHAAMFGLFDPHHIANYEYRFAQLMEAA
jgi:pimeloyl-ACP methyl ester carboxylesterase